MSPLRQRLLDYAEEQANRTGTKEEYSAAIDEMRRSDHGPRRPKQPREYARLERDLARVDRVVERFGRSSKAGDKLQFAKALVDKGVTLGRLGRSEQEIEAYNRVVARFGDASELGLREQVARALVNTASPWASSAASSRRSRSTTAWSHASAIPLN